MFNVFWNDNKSPIRLLCSSAQRELSSPTATQQVEAKKNHPNVTSAAHELSVYNNRMRTVLCCSREYKVENRDELDFVTILNRIFILILNQINVFWSVKSTVRKSLLGS